jgi:hypothetical protein
MLGTLFDRRFELKELLGRSDLGALYLATDIGTGEMVAIKCFAEGVDLRSEDGLRYLRAVRRLAGYHHPHLLAPTEAGLSATTGYQVTPYFPAQPLAQLTAEGALKLSEIETVIQQLAEGLAALHQRGLVHGNLKPSNVLVSREEGRIQAVTADPFLSWLRGADTALLHVALAPWRAPEEVPWLERKADGRSDLYALGTLAHWMLTGRLPFQGSTPAELIWRRLAEPPPPPREWNAAVPERLSAVVARLLARNPDERYQSAEMLLGDLREGTLSALGPPHFRGPPVPGIERLPLAGREPAREAALSALARARAGRGALMVFAGESGSGRQTLIESLRLPFEGAGALMLHARLPREGWCGPFWLPIVLLRELLRHWMFLPDVRRRDLLFGLHGRIGERAALLTGLSPELATILPDAGPPAPMPLERQRLRTLTVLSEAFLALAEREHPLAIAISGLDRADADSLDWLRHLFHRLPAEPVLILAAISSALGWDATPAGVWLRANERHPSLHWVHLAPLNVSQTARELSRALLLTGEDDAAVGNPVAEWLHGRWGGHPLAQRLALTLLMEEGSLAWREERSGGLGWQWNGSGAFARDPPETLSALIEALLARLPEPLYQVLEPASIFPGVFTLERLAALLPELPWETLAERVESLSERGLLLRSGYGLRFAHERLSDAIYRRIPPARRAAWHQAAGADEEQHASPPALLCLARLARHFERGEELSRAAGHGLAAAEEARRQHALHAASREYQVLLASLGDDPRAGALYAALGECHARLGDAESAAAALAEALRRAPDAAHQADTLGMMASVALGAGRREEALARAEEALRLLGEGLPAHPMGTALARLATGAATRYHQMLAATGAATGPLMGPDEERLARLLELASLALGPSQPARAALADERILHLSAGRIASPFTVRALIRLGGDDASGDGLIEAAELAVARHLPHEAARVRLARAKGALERLDVRAARTEFLEAGAAFRALGDPLGEAETLRAQLRLIAWQGPAPAAREAALRLVDLANLVGAQPLARFAEGWLAYAEALEGRRRVTEALAPIVRAAEALPAWDDPEGASELWSLAAELYLLSDQPHSAIAAARQAPPGPLGPADPLLRALLAEAHLAAALQAHEPAPALREARRLLRGLGTEPRPRARGVVGAWPAEVLESLLAGDAERALARAGEGERLLMEQELRLPLAWLAFRTAQGLKALGSPEWLTWGGRALTRFDALGAHLPRLATRRLLELGEETEAPELAPPLAPRDATALRPWPEGLAALLGTLASGAPPPSEVLARGSLRWITEALDAERAALFLCDPEGAPRLAETIPASEGAPEWINRWLVDRVWAEGAAQLLDHYQPPIERGMAWQAQSVLCFPLGAGGAVRGAIYLTSTVGRHVFGEAERLRAAELAVQAGLLLTLERAMQTARAEREQARAEARRVRERTEWALAVATLESAQAMLAAFLRDVADSHGYAAGAAFRWEREAGRLEPVTAVARSPMPLPALAGASLQGEEAGRVREALERQQPVALRRIGGEAERGWEPALLQALDAWRGLWLPLVARGESFGAVLLGAPDAGTGHGPAVLEELAAWLRAIAPTFQQAWERDALRTRAGALAVRSEALERLLAAGRSLLPIPLRARLDPERAQDAPAIAEWGGTLVLAGHVRGWDRLAASDPATGLSTLHEYFRHVDEALALHHGRLEHIGDGTWLARCGRGAESALWAARAVIGLLRRWQTESERPGARRLRTGLGLHLGDWTDALAETEHRSKPLVLGEGVVTARRMAALNFQFHTDVLVSQTALEALADPSRFELRPLGSLRLEPGPGRLRYHEFYVTRDGESRARITAHRQLWNTALQQYRAGDWKAAGARLREYLAVLPDDRPARLFLRACQRNQSEREGQRR